MMKKNFSFLLFSLLIIFVFKIDCSFAHKSNSHNVGNIYADCGSLTGVIINISITNCTKTPCIFERGNSYSIQVNFTSKVDTKSVQNHVYGIIAKVPVPFHLPSDDGCSLGVSCPVKSGSMLSESVTLPILNEYPRINLYVKWIITDDNNKQLICFLFPVSLK